MASKCLKCGAEIPDNAQFCPGCGATKPQPTQQPSQQRPVQQTQPPMRSAAGQGSLEDLGKTLFSKKMIVLAVAIGLLMVFLGATITNFTNDPTEPWEDRVIARVGSMINQLGVVGISLMLISGGIVNTKFDKYTRFGMILGGALIFGW